MDTRHPIGLGAPKKKELTSLMRENARHRRLHEARDAHSQEVDDSDTATSSLYRSSLRHRQRDNAATRSLGGAHQRAEHEALTQLVDIPRGRTQTGPMLISMPPLGLRTGAGSDVAVICAGSIK